jgi:hypothetical protein
MNTHRFGNSVRSTNQSASRWIPSIEPLESRRLLSGTLLSFTILPTPSPTPITTPIATAGRIIHAEAGQAFRAVLAVLPRTTRIPPAYTLHGIIDWGDASPPTAATFLRQPNGSIDVIGSHTYAKVGTDAIKIIVSATPPPGTTLPVLLVAQLRSAARVIASPGGVTVQATAAVPFTAAVGSFSSTLSSLNMTATIHWGDGTTSLGRIVAEPVADPSTSPIAGGRFEVFGTHTYANARSYLVNVVVTSTVPPPLGPVVDPTTTDLTVLVANIDSVIDVLPISPIATVT